VRDSWEAGGGCFFFGHFFLGRGGGEGLRYSLWLRGIGGLGGVGYGTWEASVLWAAGCKYHESSRKV